MHASAEMLGNWKRLAGLHRWDAIHILALSCRQTSTYLLLRFLKMCDLAVIVMFTVDHRCSLPFPLWVRNQVKQ